jgi:hypothetical protein
MTRAEACRGGSRTSEAKARSSRRNLALALEAKKRRPTVGSHWLRFADQILATTPALCGRFLARHASPYLLQVNDEPSKGCYA